MSAALQGGVLAKLPSAKRSGTAPDWEPDEPGEASPVAEVLNDSRPKVRLPGDEHLLSQTGEEMGRILSARDFFVRGGLVFTLDKIEKRLSLVSPELFRTLVEYHIVPFRLSRRGVSEVVTVKRTVSLDIAKGILASPQFIEQLRVVERVNAVRQPIMRADGEISLLGAGYDAESRTFSFESAPFPTDMDVQEARKVIDNLLFEFRFADAGRSKAVAVSAMITLFAGGLLPEYLPSALLRLHRER